MRGVNFFTLAGFSSFASSQLINLDYVNAQPDPTYTIVPDQRSQVVPYNQATAIASVVAEALHTPVPDPGEDDLQQRDLLEKRLEACQSTNGNQNTYGAVLDPASSFLDDQKLQDEARTALTPSGYTRVYQNLKRAAQANGYMGYTIMPGYNVQWCADKCTRTLGCQAFNTYFERSPSIVPGPSCPNPSGVANPFCVLWGGPVSDDNARNDGQWREQFQVVISASNGYVATSSLSRLSSKAINSPMDCNNNDSYMGMRLLTDNAPFDKQRCEAICEATSQYNIDHPQDPTQPPRLCKFYNTYILNKNYISQGQVCSMYTQFWDPEVYALNDGQYDGEGNHYTISSSVFFHNETDITSPVCPADITTLRTNADAGAFCTSYNSYTAPTPVTVTTSATVQVCSNPTNLAKRDDGPGGLVEAVVAVYPSKVADPDVTGTVPALVTIPAESLSVANIYASATSEAIAELNGAQGTSDDFSTSSPTSLTGSTTGSAASVVTPPAVSSAAVERRAVTTPQILAGRDSREISSACSQIIDTSTPTRTVEAATKQTSYSDCAEFPTTCGGSSSAQLIAGSFTNAGSDIDDVYYTVQLPFPVCIYDTCSTTVHPSTNGLITLGNFGTTVWTNQPISSAGFSDPALFVYWDDLYLFRGKRHYMSYSVCGSRGHRTVTFDWHVAHFQEDSNKLYRFSATFYEDNSKRINLRYFSTSDKGNSAAVGMQGSSAGRQTSYQYTYNRANIPDGLSLIFDPSTNFFGPEPSR